MFLSSLRGAPLITESMPHLNNRKMRRKAVIDPVLFLELARAFGVSLHFPDLFEGTRTWVVTATPIGFKVRVLGGSRGTGLLEGKWKY